MVLTNTKYRLIKDELDLFHFKTNNYYIYDFGWEDVLFTLMESEPDNVYILNDWDEGKNNDPYWDEEKDKHCIYSFLEDIYYKYK